LRAKEDPWDASSRFSRPTDRRSPRGCEPLSDFFEELSTEEKELQGMISLCKEDVACFFGNVGSLLVKDVDRGREFLLKAICDDDGEDDMEDEYIESGVWSELVSMLVS